MAKLDIDFILIDESVVMNGFRALMLGAMLDGFKANPVMLFMHTRAEGGMFEAADNEVMLPIGKWYDIRVEGNKLLAKPWFDDNDEFALKIQSKVEGGFLNAASIWIEPIEVSDDTALMLPGQKGPTITKWGLFEASIVDIPNCRNALAIRNKEGGLLKLYAGGNEDEILNQLNKYLPTKNLNMDKKLLAVKLGLTENADDNAVAEKLAAVLADAGSVLTLKNENTKLKGDVVAAQNEAAQLKLAADAAKIETLVQGAVDAKKIVAGDKDKYVKLAAADFETTSALLSAMKPYVSIEQQHLSEDEKSGAELAELNKLSGRDLYMTGKLERLKQLSMPAFKLKFKEYYGSDYTGA